MVRITEALSIPDAELLWSYARSSGPGGQNVNKVASKAVLRWDVGASPSVPEEVKARLRAQQRRRITTEGELVLSSQRFRDQERNRQDCLEKLCEMVRTATVVQKARKKKRPTRASKERRLAEKRHQSAAKSTRRKPTGE
jgi:ribosome-associated protein